MEAMIAPASASDSRPDSRSSADSSTRNAPEIARWEIAPQTLCIRILRESDTPLLEWHGGTDLRDWYQKQWRAHETGEITVLVADFNDFPIGQAAIHWHGKPTHPQIPDIQSLRVFGAFQGMGIGTKLIHACESAVRHRVEHEGEDHTRISISVSVENPRAKALYERLGFVVVGDTYEDKWHYVDARGQTIYQSEIVYDLVKAI